MTSRREQRYPPLLTPTSKKLRKRKSRNWWEEKWEKRKERTWQTDSTCEEVGGGDRWFMRRQIIRLKDLNRPFYYLTNHGRPITI